MASISDLLKQYDLEEIVNKLENVKISIQMLKWLDITNDFDELVKELDINSIQKIKFRAIIKELQSKQSLNVDFNQRHNKINQISICLENEINLKFQEIMTKLQNKQNQLLLEIQDWKLQKIRNNNNGSIIYEPKIDFSSNICLNDISSFVNIQFMEEKELKSLSSILPKINKLNPFCDDYSDIDDDKIDINNNLEQIHLEYFDHRKHFINDDINNKDEYHPNKLLDLYNNDKYYSDKICNFNKNDKENHVENDWIIFKTLHENQLYIPQILEIKNHSNQYAVKCLSLSIGNDKGEWFVLNKNNIMLSNKNIFSQKINLDLKQNINQQLIIDKKLNYFKIELIENYGANAVEKSKFCLHFIGLYGKQINNL